MKIKYTKLALKLLSVFFVIFLVVSASYTVGFVKGLEYSARSGGKNVSLFSFRFDNPFKKIAFIPSPTATPSQSTPLPSQAPQTTNQNPRPTWGGPELWELVNNTRTQNGVNALGQENEICTIAAIRLNELLELGKLDGHEGFSTLPDRRPDLKYIYEKYNLTEFLLSGAQTAQEAVDLWNNTLAHKKLLTGGEYVWGCIYAQYGFAVAITAY